MRLADYLGEHLWVSVPLAVFETAVLWRVLT